MKATVLKNVLDGDFSTFKEEFCADVDEKIKERIKLVQEKFPNFMSQELGLSEAKKEDVDENENSDNNSDENDDNENTDEDEK